MRPKRPLTAILSFVMLMLVSTGCYRTQSEYFSKSAIVFQGSGIALSVRLLGDNSKAAFDEMVLKLNALDKQISLTREDSVFTYFNDIAAEGEAVEIEKSTFDMLNLALEYERLSARAFNIAILPLAVMWNLTIEGYSAFDPWNPSSEPLKNTLPTLNEVNAALEYCNTDLLSVYEGEGESEGKYFIEKSDKRLKLDLGAIAKGYGADLCYQIMKDFDIESGVVDLSGNLAILNNYFDGKEYTKWLLGIDNPRPRTTMFRGDICSIEIDGNISVVTSGDYERYYVHETIIERENSEDEIIYNALCHIIDGRTGIPAGLEFAGETGDDNIYRMMGESLSSSTILCESSAMADAFSTAAFAMGLDDALEFLNEQQGVRAVLFSENYLTSPFSASRMAVVGNLEFVDNQNQGYKDYERVNA